MKGLDVGDYMVSGIDSGLRQVVELSGLSGFNCNAGIGIGG